MKRNDAGNVLLIIFAGIALFAALSYAVTQSTRGGANMDKERASLTATYLIEWHMKAKSHYDTLRFTKGYAMNHLSLSPPGNGWHQPCNRNVDPSCVLFDHREYNGQEYGTLKYIDLPPEDFLKETSGGGYKFSNPNVASTVEIVRINGIGDQDKGDIVMMTQVIRDDICQEINRQLGFSNTFPLDTFSTDEYSFHEGDPIPEPSTGANYNIGDEEPELAGKEVFCVRHGNFGGTQNILIGVLDAR